MIYIIIGIIVLIILYILIVNNSIIKYFNRVKEAFSTMDVYLKKRFDLIPNLVETVKGYTKHESETLENVIKARNTYLTATTPEGQMEADGELTKAVSKLFALTESYPDLKANTNFMSLQGQLEETENKISSARQFYNDTVLKYNNKIEVIPSNIVASLFHFEKEPFFKANEQERENVQVKF